VVCSIETVEPKEQFASVFSGHYFFFIYASFTCCIFSSMKKTNSGTVLS